MLKESQPDLLERFFQSRTEELRGASRAVLATHSGLRGGHREELCREFLEAFLPRRFSIGRGQVFDTFGHVSQECDIVIWDDQNYPRLPERGHNLFFAESVRCVVEVKTRWSTDEWKDTLQKTKSVRDLMPSHAAYGGLTQRVTHLEHQVAALLMGTELDGLLVMPPHIAYAAVFLDGGANVDVSILKESVSDVDDMLPELTLLLEPGLTIEKMVLERQDRLIGWAGVRRLDKDALLGFSLRLLELVHERSAHSENPLIFQQVYRLDLDSPPAEGFDYSFTRPVASTRPFYVARDLSGA